MEYLHVCFTHRIIFFVYLICGVHPHEDNWTAVGFKSSCVKKSQHYLMKHSTNPIKPIMLSSCRKIIGHGFLMTFKPQIKFLILYYYLNIGRYCLFKEFICTSDFIY